SGSRSGTPDSPRPCGSWCPPPRRIPRTWYRSGPRRSLGVMTSTAEPLVFNPFDPEFRVDPYKSYRRFLAEDPVHQSMFGGWVVTRSADCVGLLRDTRM